MSIDRASVQLWAIIKPHLPPWPVVLEIGQANWFGDVPVSEVDAFNGVTGLETLNLFELARLYYSKVLDFSAIDSVDMGGPNALRYDLNEPLPLTRDYDIVINTGTAEHVFDQRQVFETIHDRTRQGGIMVHAFPTAGCVDHGFYNHQPNLLNEIAMANGYATLAALRCEGNGDQIIHLAWQKTNGNRFMVPHQGECAGVMGGRFLPVNPDGSKK